MNVTYDVGSLANWLSALATISATVVALFLATRPERQRVLIDFALSDRELRIGITNPSNVPLFVRDVGWTTRRFGWRSAVFSEEELDENTAFIWSATESIPCDIAAHDRLQLLIEIEYGDSSCFPARLKRALAARSWFNRSPRFVVQSGNGRRYAASLPSSLVEEITSKA